MSTSIATCIQEQIHLLEDVESDVTRVVPRIVPERFTSITEAQRDPIVSPELTSITRINDLDQHEAVIPIFGL